MNKLDPEVNPKKQRKKFTVKYKLEMLKKVEECENGDIGGLLRKEGLYYSYIKRWQKEYKQGVLQALGDRKRGRKKKEGNPLEKKIEILEKEKMKLEKKLRQAEKIIAFQKKIAELLETEE